METSNRKEGSTFSRADVQIKLFLNVNQIFRFMCLLIPRRNSNFLKFRLWVLSLVCFILYNQIKNLKNGSLVLRSPNILYSVSITDVTNHPPLWVFCYGFLQPLLNEFERICPETYVDHLISPPSCTASLRCLIAYSPVRSYLKGTKGHAGNWACDRFIQQCWISSIMDYSNKGLDSLFDSLLMENDLRKIWNR